jgi:hypothetical protein
MCIFHKGMFMSVPERPQKQSPTRSKPAPVPAHESAQSPEFIAPITNPLSPASLISLQRMIGNQAVQRMVTPRKPKAIQRIPFEVGETSDSEPASGEIIQRQIEPIEGESSGWFRKGRRDKINIMVEAYNSLEMSLSGAKRTAASYQTLLPEIRKIWQAAREWQMDVMKKNPAKAAEIGLWMTSEVEREEDAKNAQINELQEAAGLKAASDGAAYNALYATAEYTTSTLAGAKWLSTPAIAPIYRYFLIQIQYEGVALKAYEAVMAYRQNPSKAEGLRIYHEFEMNKADKLNITGEGPKVGGVEAIAGVRRQFEAMEADAAAPVPAHFGPIETSLFNIMNEMFIAFRTTEPYKKVITPPAAG